MVEGRMLVPHDVHVPVHEGDGNEGVGQEVDNLLGEVGVVEVLDLRLLKGKKLFVKSGERT